MTVSFLSDMPPAPDSATQPEATFDAAANLFTAAMVVLQQQFNTSIGQFNADVSGVNTQAAAVAASAALVAANTEATQAIWAQIVAELTNGATGSSTSSIAIGTGTKSFGATSGKLWSPGMALIVRSGASAANYMYGKVSSYDVSTGALNLIVLPGDTGGSGTHSDWAIYPAGSKFERRWEVIDTKATTSGSSVTFGTSPAIPATYDDLRLIVLGLSHNSGSSQFFRVELSDDGINWTGTVGISGSVAAGATLYGRVDIDAYRFAAGVVEAKLSDLTTDRSVPGSGFSAEEVGWRIAAGVRFIRVSVSGGALDAGSIQLLAR